MKALIEFRHTLYAEIDDHKIEAGLDDASFSFIKFDGEIIEYKERLI